MRPNWNTGQVSDWGKTPVLANPQFSYGSGDTWFSGIGGGHSGVANISAAANTVYLNVFLINRTITVTAMGLNVGVTGTAANAQIALWQCNQDGTNLAACSYNIRAQGNVAVGTTGYKTVDITDVQIPPGVYLIGVVGDGTWSPRISRYFSGLSTRRAGQDFAVTHLFKSLTYSTNLGDLTPTLTVNVDAGAEHERCFAFFTWTTP